MPELPDLEAYLAALRPRVVDARLDRVRITGVSLLRTYDPPVDRIEGSRIVAVSRLGKRLVFEVEHDHFLILHLMIAGRLRWREHGAKVPAKIGMAAFDVSAPGDPQSPGGSLVLTEAGTKRRASLHLVVGRDALAEHDRGGLEPLEVDRETFAAQLTQENRTLKRALTDPRRFAGIGNAFSDEILHAAGLSPVRRTHQLDDDAISRLHAATVEVLTAWTDHLVDEVAAGFPEQVTAFREGFAVHGRYERTCPTCGTQIQRIRYASNETNYCPRCQTDGRVLADRSLSRLLRDDWPRTVDELEGA